MFPLVESFFMRLRFILRSCRRSEPDCVDMELPCWSVDVEFMFDELERLFVRDPFCVEFVVDAESIVPFCADEPFVPLLLELVLPVLLGVVTCACALKLATATSNAPIITTFFITVS